MKLLRRVLIGIAIVAVLVALVIVLAFTSGVQTWAVRRVVAGQPGLKAEVERVDAGLKVIEIGRIRLERPGMVFTLPGATVEVPLVPAATGKVQVQRLVAKGWMLELTDNAASSAGASSSGAQSAAAKTPGASDAANQAASQAKQAFDGIFRMLNLPVDFSLGQIDVEGEVLLLPAASGPSGRVKVSLSGGGLEAGRDGRFNFTARVALADQKAPVSVLETSGFVTVRMATPRTFERFAGTVETKASGVQFPQGTSVLADFDCSATSKGESYSFIVLAADRQRRLVDLSASLPTGASTLQGRWRLDATHADVAPFLLGQTLPSFGLVGEGTIDVARTLESLRASGRVDAKVEQLEVLSPELRVLGQITGLVDFDISGEGKVFRVDRLSGALSGAKPIASVQALQRIEFNAATGEVKIATPGAELLRLTLHGLPLSWLKPFVKDLVVTGDDVRAEFFASTRAGNGFAVRPSAPITVTNLSVAQADKPLLKNVDVAVRLTADYTPHGWQADVSEVAVRSGGAQLFLLSVKAGQAGDLKQPVKATGRYEANLPAILAQPAAAGMTALTQGVARGEFSASVDSVCKAMCRVELVGLAAGEKQLPSASLDARLDLQKDGSIEAVVPVLIDAAGRKSDLEISAHAKPAADKLTIDAEVRSNSLNVADLQLYQAALPPAAAPASSPTSRKEEEKAPAPEQNSRGKPAPAPAPQRDTQPFWKGIAGQVKLELKQVVYSPEIKTSITGTLRIEDAAILIESMRAGLATDSEAVLNGSLTFDGKGADPYALNGQATVTNFDPVPFFRAISPDSPPTVEGRFNVVTKFSGAAPTPALLANRVRAEAGLTSKSGIFRGLAMPGWFSERFQSKSGGLISNIGGVVGAIAGSKVTDPTQAVRELVSLLSAPRYDQLNVQLVHDMAAGSTQLNEFTLISPQLRLIGSGSVLRQEGVSFLNQPLTAALEMSVHGTTTKLLSRYNILKETTDSLGYTPLFTPIKVDGTLAAVGKDAFVNLLVQRLLSNTTGGLGNLFGK